MNQTPALSERSALLIFLVLTPVLGILIPLALPVALELSILLMAFVPALMAIGLAAMSAGGPAGVAMLRQLGRWRIGLGWYAAALGLPLALHLAVAALAWGLGWLPAIQFRSVTAAQWIIGLFILLLAALEELGWRGFALPRLLARRSGLASGLVIGVAWGLFHLGIGVMTGRPLLPTFLVPFGASVVFVWLCLHTRGSLAAATLFHAGLNFLPMFFAGLMITQFLWLEAIVLLAASLMLLLAFGPSLQRQPAGPAALAETGRQA